MKSIINGKKYDTSTAEQLGNYTNSLSDSDFRNIDEDLYRKENGEFFLAGEGGPLTKYAQNVCGGGKCSGRGIVPLSVQEAQEWAEKNLRYRDYVEIFGEPEE